MKQLTDVDLIKIVGAGWRVQQQVEITKANQTQEMQTFIMDPSCRLDKVLINPYSNKVAGYTKDDWLVQVGWTVVYITSADDVEDALFISPAGKVWTREKCAQGTLVSPTQVTAAAGIGIGGLLALGALAWWLLSDKKK